MKKNVFYLIGIMFLMVSCYPGDSLSTSDLDLVYTDYTETFDFSSKGTYAMPDKIVKVTGNLPDGKDPEFIDEPYNTQVLTRIATNMTNLGWTRVEDPETADLALFPAAMATTTIVYWYDYWCWYYYYYCGWGWYYPNASSYTTGTLAIGLIASGDDYVEPATVWHGALNGVLSGTYDVSRINKGIDQAFEQSPYLNVK